MELYNDQLCFTYEELVPKVISVENYKSYKKRDKITVLVPGGNGRSALIAFESLPAKVREAAIKQYGNPYEYLAKEPIAEQVRLNWDYEAETFYNEYVLPDGSALPNVEYDAKGKPAINYVKRYTEAASWLKTINVFTTDKRALKRHLNITVTEFWDTVTDLIQAKDVALPTNPRSLKNKLKLFNTSECKYTSLIEKWRFGNDHTKKVKDEAAEALLLQMIGHHDQFDATVIAAKYNVWAVENGRLPISPATVNYRARQHWQILTLQREGKGANYTKISKQIQSDRPSAPLLLAVCDDNIIDLYFRKETTIKGKKVVNEQYRVAMYVVKDYYNDYILGFAIGETVTKELIYAAFRNAMQHITEITGGNYLFHQLQSDKWAIDPKLKSELAVYFQSLAHFTPGTTKASQTKRIEQSFGAIWHQQLKELPYNNYAGHNVTAKERQNPDAIQALKKNYPSVDHALEICTEFVNNMRKTVNSKTGKCRQEEWIEAFKASEKSKKRQISQAQRIQLFGITHPKTVKISQKGLVFDLHKQSYRYDIPDEHYLDNLGKTVKVMYEPHNMEQVLITDDRGLRLVVSTMQAMPSALADFQAGDRERLNNLLEAKTKMMLGIQEKLNDRLDILSRNRIDAESILKVGVSAPKELSQAANNLYIGSFDEDQEYDFSKLM